MSLLGPGLRRLAPAILMALAPVLAAAVPDPPTVRPHERRISLGSLLFNDPRLSSTGTVSCATCHDPVQSFTDGRRHSRGELGFAIGRNAPAVFTLAHVARYPDPGGSVALGRRARALQRRRPRASVHDVLELGALALEERCLSPLSNPLEMGSSVEAALTRVRAMPAMARRFDGAFGEPGAGVTRKRLGVVLASFVRSLEPPMSPYAAFLAGNTLALSPRARSGLRLFNGAGRCSSCHSGPALSDGRLHEVATRGCDRIRKQERRRRLEAAATLRALRHRLQSRGSLPDPDEHEKTRRLLLRGGYGAGGPRIQTLPLWDVERTAPYFRDGSGVDLTHTVRTHIEEMRMVSRLRAVVPARPAGLAPSLRPRVPDGSPLVTPAILSSSQVDDLVTFLGTLSPDN